MYLRQIHSQIWPWMTDPCGVTIIPTILGQGASQSASIYLRSYPVKEVAHSRGVL